MATTSAERIQGLDMVRGIAVMGILIMNINEWALGGPTSWIPNSFGKATSLDYGVWWFDFLFGADKFRGLFSIMFGASTLLVIERAVSVGRSAVFTHYSRMVWLLFFGFLHYTLLWANDILQLYALCGMLLFLVYRLPIRWLLAIAAAAIAYSLYQSAVQFGPLIAAQLGWITVPEDGQLAAMINGMNMVFSPDSPVGDNYIQSHMRDYADIMHDRASTPHAAFMLFMQYGAETLSLMLIGMSLLKSGMLTGNWSSAAYRKWAAIGIGTGLAGNILIGLWLYSTSFTGSLIYPSMAFLTIPFDFAMSIGYAAAIMWLTKAYDPEAITSLGSRIAATGRMAFTNYLMTSVVMTTLFYGYGLGLVGKLGRAEAFLLFLAMCALMLLWSKPWLERFQYGPFEWLWRSLARFKPQPMLKKPAPAIAA